MNSSDQIDRIRKRSVPFGLKQTYIRGHDNASNLHIYMVVGRKTNELHGLESFLSRLNVYDERSSFSPMKRMHRVGHHSVWKGIIKGYIGASIFVYKSSNTDKSNEDEGITDYDCQRLKSYINELKFLISPKKYRSFMEEIDEIRKTRNVLKQIEILNRINEEIKKIGKKYRHPAILSAYKLVNYMLIKVLKKIY